MNHRIWLAMLLAAIIIGTSSTNGRSYPQQPNNCADSSLRWYFASSDLWTQNRKDWVRDGINDLENTLDYDGTKLITTTQTPEGSVSVQLRDMPGGLYGSSECVLPEASFWVNVSYTNDSTFYRRVARHEMFHLGGAEHGGQLDSFDGVDPTTVATCISWPLFPSGGLEQDGHAYVNWLWSQLDYRQQNANIGFEQGMRFWGKTGGVPVNEYSTGGATGPGHIAWGADNIYDYLYQTVRIINGDDTGQEYRARANARAPNSDYNWTRARVMLYRRTVDLLNDPGSPNTCSYPDGIVNPNGGVSVNGWIQMTESDITAIGTSWEAFNTSNPTQWVDPPTQEAYDFQVRLGGYALNTSTGNYGQIRFDNVRDEGR